MKIAKRVLLVPWSRAPMCWLTALLVVGDAPEDPGLPLRSTLSPIPGRGFRAAPPR